MNRTYKQLVTLLIFLITSGSCTEAMADGADHHSCDSVAQCNALGAAAYKKNDYILAQEYFEQQVGYLEQDGDPRCLHTQPCRRSAAPYNNVALALLKSGQPRMAKAWLEIAPEDSTTSHNMDLVNKTLRDQKWPPTPEGQYWRYAGFGSWSTVSVTSNGGKWSISFTGLRFPGRGMSNGPNIGEFDVEMAIGDRQATYQDEDGKGCVVSIVFSTDSVALEQDDTRGRCEGFGYGVSAGGTFMRVSAK